MGAIATAAAANWEDCYLILAYGDMVDHSLPLCRQTEASHPAHGPVANDQSPTFHARSPFANIWRGRVTTNSVNASTSLSTVIVPPCCFVTMS